LSSPCFSVIRRPPTSTLLPSTTLFRSVDEQHLLHLGQLRVREPRPRVHRVVPQPRRHLEQRGPVPAPPRPVVLRALVRPYGRTRDRKSTRLNSSHVKISYAVFCLKKKI